MGLFDSVVGALGQAQGGGQPDLMQLVVGLLGNDAPGGGLGALLMRRMIEHLRSRGTQWLVATVLAENTRMLELARELGFEVAAPGEGEDVCGIRLRLGAADASAETTPARL